MSSPEQFESVIHDVFARLSSNGQQAVGDSFTPDGRYEGAYPASPESRSEDNALVGSETISRFFQLCLPEVLSPFSQWADTIYPVTDGRTAIAEGRSEGTATHDGSTYKNRYIWVIQLRDGKIELMREYFNPLWYHAAIGPQFQAVIERVFTDEYIARGGTASAD
jgi:ketosteroid isomerase-like protein